MINENSPNFLKKLKPLLPEAYKKLETLCQHICGTFMVHSDFKHLQRYFKLFCEKTKVIQPPEFITEHENYRIVPNMSPAEELNEWKRYDSSIRNIIDLRNFKDEIY